MADVRLRFFFGKKARLARTTKRTLNETASVIFRQVAFSYADRLYTSLVNGVQARLAKDIRYEIDHIAKLYRNFIINAPRTKNGPPSGARLYPAATNFPGGGTPLAIPGGSWAPRDPKYVARKKREGFSQGWWKRTGEMQSVLGRGQGWRAIFGDRIQVNVKRIRTQDRAEFKGSFYRLGPNTAMKIAVANIEVTALEKLKLNDLRDTMVGAAYDFDATADTQLGGRLNQGAHRTGEPRVTLEPFIDFVITRSFPHAIKRRLQTGLTGRIRDVTNAPRLRV